MSQFTTLQHIHIPAERPDGTDALFFQPGADLLTASDPCAFAMPAGGHVCFNAYANVLDLGGLRQLRKDLRVGMRIEATGRFMLIWRLATDSGPPRTLCTREIEAEAGCVLDLACPWIDHAPDGLVHLEVISLTPCRFRELSFHCIDLQLRRCHVALVITHFKREQQVRDALARLRTLTGQWDDDCTLEILVIDNSGTLGSDLNGPGVRILPNPNLGGSGGFSRGLLECMDQGGVTHCLFMDDDASCTNESVRRAVQAVRISESRDVAVAGAMLLEDRPTTLHESGAQFDGLWIPLRHHLRIDNPAGLLRMECARQRIDYGGWWFFLFPIASARTFPFPFFVRGDDVGFGLTNPFRIVDLMGVCSWQPDFSEKSSPLTVYLDTRGLLVHTLARTYGNRRAQVRKVLRHCVTRFNDGHLYASAEAALLAAKDVLQGPRFFRENPHLEARMPLLQALNRQERFETASPWAPDVTTQRPGKREHRRRSRILRWTLGGLLLPSADTPEQDVPVAYRGSPPGKKDVYRAPFVLYRDRPGTATLRAVRSPWRQFVIRLKTASLIARYHLRKGALHSDYKFGYSSLASETHWRRLLDKL